MSNKQYQASSCYFKDSFIIIQTFSGLGLMFIDHRYPPYIMDSTVDNTVLGNSVVESLKNSETFIYNGELYKDFFNPDNRKTRYDHWLDNLFSALGFKNKQSFFRKMKHCSISRYGNMLIFSPDKHNRSDSWEGLGKDSEIFLPLDSSLEEVGAALRSAMSRCI